MQDDPRDDISAKKTVGINSTDGEHSCQSLAVWRIHRRFPSIVVARAAQRRNWVEVAPDQRCVSLIDYIALSVYGCILGGSLFWNIVTQH